MEKKAFQLLHDSERSWWYRGRKRVVERVLNSFYKNLKGNILDVGAGFGGMHSLLSPYGEVDGFEPESAAREIAQSRGYRRMFLQMGEIGRSGMRYDLIGAFDVLEHTEHDLEFLKQLYGFLRPGGTLAITVPANQWLWSSHDVSHHHFRRYTKKQFIDVLQKAGFVIRYISFWNMCLLFPAIVARVLGTSGESSMKPGSFMDAIFTKVVLTESQALPTLRFPFGVSLVTLVEKPML